MKKKGFVLMVAALLLVSVGLMLDAAPQRQKMMRHAGFGMHMVEQNLFPARMLLSHKDEIGLTTDQITKIEKMDAQAMETCIRRKADVDVLELKFSTFLKAESIDRTKLEKMIREIATLKTELQIARINHMLDVKNVLTAEQLVKIEQFKKEMRQRRFQDKGKNHQRGDRQRGDRQMGNRGPMQGNGQM